MFSKLEQLIFPLVNTLPNFRYFSESISTVHRTILLVDGLCLHICVGHTNVLYIHMYLHVYCDDAVLLFM